MKKQCGIIYCAIGKQHLEMAEISYKSILVHSPEIKASIYTDQVIESKIWHNVFISKSESHYFDNNLKMSYKLNTLLISPYKETLYLDADTYILDDISDLFQLLRYFDFVFCHGHNRFKRYNMWQSFLSLKGKDSEAWPYCFSPIQGGLLLYKKSSTLSFLRKLKSTFLDLAYFDDQIILRELLPKSNLRIYVLPPEYNFNSIKYLKRLVRTNYREAKPKIFHYTLHKGKNIKDLVERVYSINSTRVLKIISIFILRE